MSIHQYPAHTRSLTVAALIAAATQTVPCVEKSAILALAGRIGAGLSPVTVAPYARAMAANMAPQEAGHSAATSAQALCQLVLA